MKDIKMMAGLIVPLPGIIFVLGIGQFVLLKTINKTEHWFDQFTIRCGLFYGTMCILAAGFNSAKIFNIQQSTLESLIIAQPHPLYMLFFCFVGLPFLLFVVDIHLQSLRDIIPEVIFRMLYLLEVTTVQVLALWIASVS